MFLYAYDFEIVAGSNSAGVDFYGPSEAQDSAVAHEEELGIKLLSFEMIVYSKEHDKYFPINKVPEGIYLVIGCTILISSKDY